MVTDRFVNKNMEIRRMLQDIISVAYKDVEEKKLNEYKKFFIEISKKNIKSYAGIYHPSNKSITIVGIDRPVKSIVITTIHELSHHIDYMNRNISDHGPEFYSIFEKLIHAALDMGIVSKEDIMAVSDVTDRNKIKKFLDHYVPCKVSYKENSFLIYVEGGFEKKNLLKQHGYKWDGLSKRWYIETDNTDQEKDFLDSIGLMFSCEKANDVRITAKCTILATNGSYEYKDILKEKGYIFDNKLKGWKKLIDASDYKKEIEDLQRCGLSSVKISRK